VNSAFHTLWEYVCQQRENFSVKRADKARSSSPERDPRDFVLLGQTVLCLASGGGKNEAAEALPARQRELLDTQEAAGDTALHCAIRDAWSKEVVEKLLEAGADVGLENEKGDPPFHLAVDKSRKTVIDMFDTRKCKPPETEQGWKFPRIENK